MQHRGHRRERYTAWGRCSKAPKADTGTSTAMFYMEVVRWMLTADYEGKENQFQLEINYELCATVLEGIKQSDIEVH